MITPAKVSRQVLMISSLSICFADEVVSNPPSVPRQLSGIITLVQSVFIDIKKSAALPYQAPVR